MALSTVTQDDIAEIVDMQNKAFADDMLGYVLFPQTPATNAWWAEGLKEAIADSKYYIVKYTEDNKIVGYAKWEMPQTLDLETVKSSYVKPVPWGEDSDHDFNNAWLWECYKFRLEYLQNRPHWCMEYSSKRSFCIISLLTCNSKCRLTSILRSSRLSREGYCYQVASKCSRPSR